jgi:hypothetical protein
MLDTAVLLPKHMAEVVRIMVDVGSNGVATGVPDVMTGLRSTMATAAPGTTAPPDSAPGGGGEGGYPGFMGIWCEMWEAGGQSKEPRPMYWKRCGALALTIRRPSTGPSSPARRLGSGSSSRCEWSRCTMGR